jgi:hypothetical protein
LGLTALINLTVAYADGDDIGLVIGASGLPIPGSLYVEAADDLYLKPTYGDLTFYQATPSPPTSSACLIP